MNGSGRSPAALTLEHVRAQGVKGRTIPSTNLNSVTVPGAAAAWVDAVEAFGSGKLTVADVLAPAIRLAEEGCACISTKFMQHIFSHFLSACRCLKSTATPSVVTCIHSPSPLTRSMQWQRSEPLIKAASPDANAMLLNGRAPLPGEVMHFPDLAKTFRAIAEHGKDGFYKGRVAQAVVDLIKSKGGVMELSDLESHTSDFVEPIKYTYADEVTIYEVRKGSRM